MEVPEKLDARRAIPPINEILDCPDVKVLTERIGRTIIIDNIKLILDDCRKNIDVECNTREEIKEYVVKKLQETIEEQLGSGLKTVINATGIVLHTNLGRAPLPKKAASVMQSVGSSYSNLEFDLETGGRGSRHSHIESLIAGITGAESAVIVNNNAAAVFLTLNTLALSREVVISRGQQVEIGGSFRIPDIIARSGAKMVEVGTTNKTRLTDYSNAISEQTAAFLKVHTSNYKVTGFAEEVPTNELVKLGKEKDIVVIEDLGSGCLFDLSKIGLPYEPTVQDTVKSGVDIVTFSGDKLLGGPQAGIIAGKKELIEAIKKNPLMRMVRCDKTTIAAMAAVLDLYKNEEKAVENIPVLKMMGLKSDQLLERASMLHSTIVSALGDKYSSSCLVEIIDDLDEVGGGSLPGVILDGKAVALELPGLNVNEIQTQLRKNKVPVIARIHKDRILLNVRTLEESDYTVVAEAIAKVLG